MTLGVLQAIVFWHGMESIRRFIDWAGPAVYVVMIVLAVYLVAKAGIPEHRPDAWHRVGGCRGHGQRGRAGGVVLLRPDAELW